MPLNNPLSYLNALRMGPGSIPGINPGTVPVHDVFSNLPEQAQNLAQRTKDTARNFGTATINKARAARDATSAAMRNGAANVAARASALGDVTLGQAARTLAKGSLPTALALGTGYAMYNKAAEDYQQYLNNVQREGGVTHLRDENGTWIPTNNDNEWRNIVTNELMTYNNLDPNRNAEFIPQGSYQEGVYGFTENPNLAIPETVGDTETPESTITTPGATTIQTTSTPVTNTSSGNIGKGSKNLGNKPKKQDALNPLNALIPLLALGGLGYYMARR